MLVHWPWNLRRGPSHRSCALPASHLGDRKKGTGRLLSVAKHPRTSVSIFGVLQRSSAIILWLAGWSMLTTGSADVGRVCAPLVAFPGDTVFGAHLPQLHDRKELR